MMEEEVIYEASEIIEEDSAEVVEIEMLEAFQAPTISDSLNHALLNNREIHDAHPITAITGLREELDSIEALQTIYSNKWGNADYYAWADGLAVEQGGVGYFVTLNEDAHTISICSGDDIFGVVVDTAAFVGGQSDIARDNHYGLVATTGAVLVRCELDVAVGDYVVSNSYGVATSAASGYGYKVASLHDIDGIPYATINLNISGDQVHLMGAELQELSGRVKVNEQNIVSAVNVSNQAYNKAQEAATSSSVSEEAVKEALESILRSEGKITDFEQAVGSASAVSAQARAIAESAATSANAIREEAVEVAKNAITQTTELKEEFSKMENQITDVEGKVTLATKYISSEYVVISDDPGVDSREQSKLYYNATETKYYEYVGDSWQAEDALGELDAIDTDIIYYVVSTKRYWYYQDNLWKDTENAYDAGLPMAVSGLQVKSDETGASINSLVSWQDTAKSSMARIEQKADANGAHIQSTVFNIDKYSVGPYSQAYGFTLEQAAMSFEGEIFYVPTESVAEEYSYTTEGTKCDSWDATGKDNRQVYYVVSIAEDGTETKTYYYWGYSEENNRYQWITSSSIPVYERSFLPGYLYKWGRINETRPYRWITVDKDYNPLETINDSTKSVYFSNTEILLDKSDNNNNYGYWYTQVSESDQTIYESGGTTPTTSYKPYTLYKWESYASQDEDGNDITRYHWVAVATLAGNSQNRITSMIRQDANKIEMSVIDVKGDYAGVRTELTGTMASVNSLADWRDGKSSNKAIIRQEATEDGSQVVIAALKEEEDKIKDMATLILQVDEDKSSILIDAGNINFTGNNYTVNAGNIDFTGENYTIDAGRITFKGNTQFLTPGDLGESGSTQICGDRITAGLLKGPNYAYTEGKMDENGEPIEYSDTGMAVDLNNGCLRSTNFALTTDGKIVAQGVDIKGIVEVETGKIGGWTLAQGEFGAEGTVPALTSEEFTDDNNYKYQMYLTPEGLWMYTEEYGVKYRKPWRELSLIPEITIHNIKGGRRLLLQNPYDKTNGLQKYFDFMDKTVDDTTTLMTPTIRYLDDVATVAIHSGLESLFGGNYTGIKDDDGNYVYGGKTHELRIEAGSNYKDSTETIYYEIYNDGELIDTVERNDIDIYVNKLVGEPNVIYSATVVGLKTLCSESKTYHITVRAKCEGYDTSSDSETRIYIVPKPEETESIETAEE